MQVFCKSLLTAVLTIGFPVSLDSPARKKDKISIKKGELNLPFQAELLQA
jgi:hypothetical protein